jgi:hypothetical protein
LNVCFQIQGHSRTLKFCTNPGSSTHFEIKGKFEQGSFH